MNFLSINSTLLLSKYFGETEANIRKLFSAARAVSPCILFFDEFEVISKKRFVLCLSMLVLACSNNYCIRSMDSNDSGETDGGVGNRVLSTFLNELDGISPSGMETVQGGDLIVIAACGSIDNLDAAIIRPGRLQYHFLLEDLTENEMVEIVALQLKRYPGGFCKGITAQEIVQRMLEVQQEKETRQQGADTSKITPSDIVSICSGALLRAVKSNINAFNNGSKCAGTTLDEMRLSDVDKEKDLFVMKDHIFDEIIHHFLGLGTWGLSHLDKY